MLVFQEDSRRHGIPLAMSRVHKYYLGTLFGHADSRRVAEHPKKSNGENRVCQALSRGQNASSRFRGPGQSCPRVRQNTAVHCRSVAGSVHTKGAQRDRRSV